MKYNLIFLTVLTTTVTLLSILVKDVELFLVILLIAFLLLYSLFNPYFNRRVRSNLDIILYLGLTIFTIITVQKILEILSRR